MSTQPPINRDRDNIFPPLLAKIDAVVSDVNGHLPDGYRLALFEGIRTQQRQDWLYEQRDSRGRRLTLTRHSRHLPAKDGLSRAGDLMFQKRVNGKWKWVSWANVPGQWIKWLDSAKRAHSVMDERIVWDHPHCQWMG